MVEVNWLISKILKAKSKEIRIYQEGMIIQRVQLVESVKIFLILILDLIISKALKKNNLHFTTHPKVRPLIILKFKINT